MLLAPADKRTKRKRYKVFAAKLSDEKSEKGETYGTGPGISWRSGDKVSSGGRRATQAALMLSHFSNHQNPPMSCVACLQGEQLNHRCKQRLRLAPHLQQLFRSNPEHSSLSLNPRGHKQSLTYRSARTASRPVSQVSGKFLDENRRRP
jgi:hypothetical protein